MATEEVGDGTDRRMIGQGKGSVERDRTGFIPWINWWQKGEHCKKDIWGIIFSFIRKFDGKNKERNWDNWILYMVILYMVMRWMDQLRDIRHSENGKAGEEQVQ